MDKLQKTINNSLKIAELAEKEQWSEEELLRAINFLRPELEYRVNQVFLGFDENR